ncbi:helix-turn-helix transcriptional regulator [Anaerolinea sp.]|uniref:helix-turn-helix transcriptional regulator n=1 Tax=Anaerolinea sp. TaxID=1872519 RepID=UPI002ACDF7B8|nr:helix-turn-helix domain-containing protein [Anaerolinea sp.]
MYKKRLIQNASPLARWLIEYSLQEEITITELSRRAGLSPGSLRSILKYPERVPALETCLKLAKATGKPVEEIFEMARVRGMHVPDAVDPGRATLLRIYDDLPLPMRNMLIRLAKVLEASVSTPQQ